MSDITMIEEQADTTRKASPDAPECGECIGSGGWFRYEPAMEPSVGTRYLSCMQCRGSGRTAPAIG